MQAPDRLLLCRCLGSQSVDAALAQRATGAGSVRVCDNLCGTELAQADAALYAGKQAGRNRVVFDGEETMELAGGLPSSA